MAAKEKELKITEVTFEQFSDYDFVYPSNFYVRDALNVYHFISTSDRLVAQRWIDEKWGAGHYTAIASRIMKTKSRLESGGQSVYATATTKGQKKYN